MMKYIENKLKSGMLSQSLHLYTKMFLHLTRPRNDNDFCLLQKPRSLEAWYLSKKLVILIMYKLCKSFSDCHYVACNASTDNA